MRRAAPLALAAVAAALVVAGSAEADSTRVETVFIVSKSTNRNQVHYGIRLDDQCRPVGDEPVVAWWQVLEEGPNVTEPLDGTSARGYGLRRGQQVERTDSGGVVTVQLRALQGRPIRIESQRRGNGDCRARAVTSIGGEPSVLRRAHASLRLFGLRHVDIIGQRLADRARVVERYDP